MKLENISKRYLLIFMAITVFLIGGVGMTFIGGENQVAHLFSQFSASNTTPATAAANWQPTTSNNYRAEVGTTNAARLDGVIRGILTRGTALNVDQFKAFLTNVDTGIKELAARPAYASDQNVQNIVSYIAFELADAKTNITSGTDFVTEMVGVINNITTGSSDTSTGTVIVRETGTHETFLIHVKNTDGSSVVSGAAVYCGNLQRGYYTVYSAGLYNGENGVVVLTPAQQNTCSANNGGLVWLKCNGSNLTTNPVAMGNVTLTCPPQAVGTDPVVDPANPANCTGTAPTGAGVIKSTSMIGGIQDSEWSFINNTQGTTSTNLGSSCKWTCTPGYTQDGNSCKVASTGVNPDIVVGGSTPAPAPAGGSCTGTLPTGPGIQSSGYTTSSFGGGSSTNTVWKHESEAVNMNGCTWSCKDGYVRDGNSCKPMAPGSGVTINVVDEASNAPLSGVSVSVIHNYCNASLLLGNYSTDAAGKTSEFYLPSSKLCGFVFKFEKAGYTIKSGTNCTSRVTGGNNYCDYGTGNSVTVKLSNGTVTTLPAESITQKIKADFAILQGQTQVELDAYLRSTTYTPQQLTDALGYTPTDWDAAIAKAKANTSGVSSPAPAPAPTPAITQGEFASSCPTKITEWYCGGTPSSAGWSDQGGGCFHRCKPE